MTSFVLAPPVEEVEVVLGSPTVAEEEPTTASWTNFFSLY